MATDEGLVDVLFYGVVQPDRDVGEVKRTLSQALKADEDRIERLFSGKKRFIKRNATQQEAERIQQLFHQAGAVIRIQPVAQAPAAASTERALPPKQKKPSTSQPAQPKVSKSAPGGRPLVAPAAAGFLVGLAMAFALQWLFGPAVHTLTEEDQALLAQLREDVRELTLDRRDVEAQMERYSGGLVLSMLTAREQTLSLSIDLVKQRIIAIESGATLSETAPSQEPNSVLAEDLRTELERQAQKAQAAESARTTGGLIGALSAATAATERQTEAMLRLRYLSAKYGLPYSVPSATPQEHADVQAIAETTGTSATVAADRADASSRSMPDLGGPFGLAMGMKKSDFSGPLAEVSPGKYTTTQVAKPFRLFETYVLKFGPDTGLCYVKAISKNISTSVYGFELQREFDTLKEKLAQRYGDHKLVDHLYYDSIWNDPKDWMMALRKKQRVLAAFWDHEEGSRLPSDISSIAAQASALASEKGYIAVDYEFTNHDACSAAIDSAQDGAL
jgi:hypothetical protein